MNTWMKLRDEMWDYRFRLIDVTDFFPPESREKELLHYEIEAWFVYVG